MRSMVSFTLFASSKSSLSTALAIRALCSLNRSPKLEICTMDPLYCSALSKSSFLMACSLSAASWAMNQAIYCSSSSWPPYSTPPPTAATTVSLINASGCSEPQRVSACSPTCEKKFSLEVCGLWKSSRKQRQFRSTIIVFCSRAAPLSFRVNCRQPYLQKRSSCPPVGTQQRMSTCEAILRWSETSSILRMLATPQNQRVISWGQVQKRRVCQPSEPEKRRELTGCYPYSLLQEMILNFSFLLIVTAPDENQQQGRQGKEGRKASRGRVVQGM